MPTLLTPNSQKGDDEFSIISIKEMYSINSFVEHKSKLEFQSTLHSDRDKALGSRVPSRTSDSDKGEGPRSERKGECRTGYSA
jgi:hypothetical protein